MKKARQVELQLYIVILVILIAEPDKILLNEEVQAQDYP
jgi:hypothetical protein